MAQTPRLAIIHRLMAVAVAIAVPVVVYIVNGSLELWAIVLGAVIGFGYWYFFPFFLP
jgi:hypothetical protein